MSYLIQFRKNCPHITPVKMEYHVLLQYSELTCCSRVMKNDHFVSIRFVGKLINYGEKNGFRKPENEDLL